MNFREFLQLEQGTQFSVTGLNAGGRAGQSQHTPESGIKQMPNSNVKSKDVQINGPKTLPRSAFAVSDKGKGLAQREFGTMNAGGIQGITAPPSSLSPRGLGQTQPLVASKGLNPVKVPKPVGF